MTADYCSTATNRPIVALPTVPLVFVYVCVLWILQRLGADFELGGHVKFCELRHTFEIRASLAHPCCQVAAKSSAVPRLPLSSEIFVIVAVYVTTL